MELRTISLKEANAFVEANHRHHKAVRGHKFSLSVWDGTELHGVAIVGRPVARVLDDKNTLEILRLCTDGHKNCCSFLYSACARAAKALGYRKIITYILKSESGVTLKASGFTLDTDEIRGRSWNTPSRPREVIQRTLFGQIEKYPLQNKKRYSKKLI